MASVCRRFGISRKTGYKWRARLKAGDDIRFKDRSHAPHHLWNATDVSIRKRLIACRKKHRTWGPRKIKIHLEERYEKTQWPAASTIGSILDSAGLTVHRSRRQKPEDPPSSLAGLTEAQAPNDVWTADYKGWFCTGDGHRCDPLTIQDRHTRFLILLRLTKTMQGPCVQRAFIRAFEEFGMPLIFRTDNGTPFASTGLASLSWLSVWLYKLGIQHERIHPGSPQENGRHERMHRTMKKEVASPPGPTVRAQNERHRKFRYIYNVERPCEALGQCTPASLYRSSPRLYTGRIDHPEYPSHWIVRNVRTNGEIRWKGSKIFLTQSLIGEPVGINQVNDREWCIYFGAMPLAKLDGKGIITPFRSTREKRKRKH